MSSLLWFLAGAGWMLVIVGIVAALVVAGREDDRMLAEAERRSSDRTGGTDSPRLWVYDGGSDAS